MTIVTVEEAPEPTPLKAQPQGGCCARRRKGRWGHCEAWRQASPVDPGPGLDAEWLSRFPLEAKGRHVVDTKGQRFKLAGVNWYGASDVNHVVGGLEVQPMEKICTTIKSLGFSMVRLPFSNEMLRCDVKPGSINFDLNPTLRGKTALEVLDEVIRCLGQHQVAVVLNNHTTYGEWCGGPDRNGLWFEPGGVLTEECWLDDWEALARRYSRCLWVIGCDIRNEVRFCPPRASSLSQLALRWPKFGAGRISRSLGACCWATAAGTCGDKILAVNPNMLIVVERIIWPQKSVKDYAAMLPRLKGRLIIGVHHYRWSGPGRYLPSFSPLHGWRGVVPVLRALGIFGSRLYGDMDQQQLKEQLTHEWGCLLHAEECPVWVSEFGGDANNPEEMQWLETFVSVLAEAEADWAYWPLNVGPKPGGEGDESYGMLAPDWTPKPEGDARLKLLSTIC